MALPVLNHAPTEAVALSTPTIAQILAAILNTTWQHWSATGIEDTGTLKAVVMRPNLAAIGDVAVIFAGSADAETGVAMQGNDTFQADTLLVRVCKGVAVDASVADWAAAKGADPFGEGTASGFIHGARATSALSHNALIGLESAETIKISLRTTTVATHCEAGCRFRRGENGPYEANGRLVGMWTTGAAFTPTANFWSTSSTNNGTPFGHHSTNQQAHVFIFDPGETTMFSPNKMGLDVILTATLAPLTDGGDFLGLPVLLLLSAPNAVLARDAFIGPKALSDQTIVDSDTQEVKAYLAGGATSGTAADTAAFRA